MILYRYFEWSKKKEANNIEKHGVYFTEVKQAFKDPYLLKKYDKAHSLTEDRYNMLGRAGKLFFVVYTERGMCIRIISARLANKKERSIYYGRHSEVNIMAWY